MTGTQKIICARLSDWESRLHEYMAANAFTEHEYGKSDCALFASGAALAMTGVDPAAEYRGKYRTELGAAKALKQIGEGDLESTLDAKFDVVPVGMARRGDWIWDGANVGVCYGAFAFFIGQNDYAPGIVRIARSEWTDAYKAWKIG